MAHRALNLSDEDWHDSPCAWQKQWDKLEDVETVVTVSNYITEERVNQVGPNILDDVSGYLEEEAVLTAEDLRGIAEGLRPLTEKGSAISESVDALIAFIERLQEELRKTGTPNKLETLSPPNFPTEGWVEKRLPEDGDHLAETLAWIQHAYREYSLLKMSDETLQTQTYYDPDDETMFHLDLIFMTAAVAGLPTDSVRRAIGATPGVEECPRCEEVSNFNKGHTKDDGNEPWGQQNNGYEYHRCDECGWSEGSDPITTEVTELPRALAWIQEDNPDQRTPTHELVYRELPLVDDLPDPDNTVILDATPVPEAYALLFGIKADDVTVMGNEPAKLNANITQIVDGQYHRGTITDDKRGEAIQGRFQQAIDQLTDRHEDVIVVGHNKCQGCFDVPDNARWVSFHAGRGLDFPEYDAVVIIGAPHTRPRDFRKDAELLAMNRNDIRIGGKEHSTRQDEEVGEPVYRKYYYEDEAGAGRAVPTKHYTGLTGELFRNRRENEVVQLAHRIRPITADEEKHIYLLTNVPTELPVDTLAKLSELIGSVEDHLDGVSSDVIKMLDECVALATEGRPRQKDRYFHEWDEDTFAATTSQYHDLATKFGNLDVTEETIRNYLDRLEELGLAKQSDNYIQRTGYTYEFDISTLKQALLVLHNGTNLEVDAFRRLSEKMAEADGTTDWLDWAEEGLEA